MLTKDTLWKDQEALALKKGDSEGTLSEVNVTSVITLLQKSNLLIIWFSVFAIENNKHTKKSKEKELSNDVSPEKWKKLHNEVRTTLFFSLSMKLQPSFLVACWQVSGERKKKKGMENDVSIGNKSEESTIWFLDLMNLNFSTDQVNGDESKCENDIFISVKLWDFLILNHCVNLVTDIQWD